jgi:maltose phosphorylase
VILAAKIGRLDKAYELYLRTSRLDLDDYNHEADEGLHITSMAGTWVSVVEGLAGVRIYENEIRINPIIPAAWTSYAFQILYKNNPLQITVDSKEVTVENKGEIDLPLTLYQINQVLPKGEKRVIPLINEVVVK